MSAHDLHSGSESEEDDFNPQPEIDEDDAIGGSQSKRESSAQVKDDEDSEEDSKQAPAPRRSVTHGAVDDDDEDEGEDEVEDEEDDEEEEEEDEVVGRSRKRRKRDARMQFIDVEAEVDEDEEEEDEEDDVPDEIHPDDLLEAAGPDLDDRRHRELDRKREAEAHLDAEQVAAQFDQKYRRREMARGPKASGPAPLALPTVDDPSIWGVKCKPGKEREIIFAITKRISERAGTRNPLRIFSAFERGGTMAGYIYVEAIGKQDMMEAMADIPNVYTGSGPISIEVKERPDLLRKRKKEPLNPLDWVRMRRPPLYAGDLAQIYEVNSNGVDCSVRIVPRLDYGLNEDINAAPDANKRKRGGATVAGPRPPARLFNEADAKKKHMKFLQQMGSGSSKTFQYKNEDYVNGLLIKEVKISYFTKKDVNPTMTEMQLFSQMSADGDNEIDLAAVQAAQKANMVGSSFVPGDNVEVFEGEQKGITGTTTSVTGDIVTLKVTQGELRGQTIDAPVRTLRKLFREGDHVKVIGGSKYIDEVGMVTKIREDKVTLLSDSTQQEITVFSKDLKRAADSAQLGNDSDFELNDLVQLDAATVAFVIKVDREVIRVLDQNGAVRNLLNSQISSKLERQKNSVATDRDGSEIRLDDIVKEHGGEGRIGRVAHIHRSHLFIHNLEIAENNGIFVVRSTNVTTMAAKSGRTQAAGPDLSKMNPTMMQGANGAAMAPPRSIGRDKMIGKTVTVRKGVYKGLLGIVKDTNGDDARIELHTKNKVIQIKKELLTIKDPITGNTVDFNGKLANRSRGMPTYGSSTPAARDWSGGRTPAWGGQSARAGAQPSWGTPAGGGRTPGWGAGASGGRTPGWGGGDGSRTAYGGGDGSRTAYGGGDGSRTAYGGATAYGGGNAGNRTAYGGADSGGRTPGGPTWGAAPSGSKTPAYNSSSTSNGANPYGSNTYAPTPGAYQAPTPAAYNSYVGAPTPGGPIDAPTPGFAAPTPGDTAHHPTPRGYGGYGGGYGATPAAAPTPGAPTPGAWPDTPWNQPETPAPADDEPRYE